MNIEMPRKKLDLSSAIAEGDIRVLLMVLVHLTGETRWLEPPYRPKRDVRLIPDPDAGVSKEIQDEIRAAVLKLYESGEPKPVMSDPGNELMLKMMRATVGENVATGICAADARGNGICATRGALDQTPIRRNAGEPACSYRRRRRVCHRTRRRARTARHPYTIVEKNDEIGGTWYVNRYPGCGVDTPNHSYSFSFGKRNPWTRYFAPRQELLDYLLKVVKEHDIRKHVRLNTELVASHWDEGKRRWISALKNRKRRRDI